jgi:hypothetical protein
MKLGFKEVVLLGALAAVPVTGCKSVEQELCEFTAPEPEKCDDPVYRECEYTAQEIGGLMSMGVNPDNEKTAHIPDKTARMVREKCLKKAGLDGG